MNNSPTRRRAGVTGVNLLIVVALGLCGLIIWQWTRETGLFQENVDLKARIQTLTDSGQRLEAKVQSLTGEISRLDGLRTKLEGEVRSNKTEVARLDRDLARTREESENKDKLVDTYKQRIEEARAIILKQNEDTKKQNEDLKRLVDDRADLVSRLNNAIKEHNKTAEEYNKLVKMYEDLAAQVKAQQEEKKK